MPVVTGCWSSPASSAAEVAKVHVAQLLLVKQTNKFFSTMKETAAARGRAPGDGEVPSTAMKRREPCSVSKRMEAEQQGNGFSDGPPVQSREGLKERQCTMVWNEV